MIPRPRGPVAAAVALVLGVALGTASCGDGGDSGRKSGRLRIGIAVANYSLKFAREM
jgi:ribose transport system substrate-binding protein